MIKNDEQTNETITVIFMPTGRRGQVAKGSTALEAARSLGVEIESTCNGRLTCGKCKVQLEEGVFHKHGITSQQAHLSQAGPDELEVLGAEGAGCRLSCQAQLLGDALLFVPEEARAQKQIIRKSAQERAIVVDPAVRKVYVEVEDAALGEHRGDWLRLQEALQKEAGLENLSIDLHALRKLQPALKKGKRGITVTLWQQEVIDIDPGYVEGIYGIAIDLGSTTIVGHLCDLRTGAILSTESMMNPQVAYGEDLMSRISYTMGNPAGLEKLHTSVIEAINKLVHQAARQAGLNSRQIHEVVLVGNTTMTNLFLGISPEELGTAPFALAIREAVEYKASALGVRMHPAGYVHILPAEAGHVGADNVAALLAEDPRTTAEMTLLIDVGTNAEIVLGSAAALYSASSPTGPAFEGAQIKFGMRAAPGAIERVRIAPETLTANFRVIGEERWSNDWPTAPDTPVEAQPRHLAAGICGSGIIEVIAEMFLRGIILPDGRFNPELQHPRLVVSDGKPAYILALAEQAANHKPILVTQDDVRNIQLAKAALYAGARLLMKRAGVTAVERIILAGAFGSYIDPQYAQILGLIPDCPLEKVYAVGNAAGDGARIALLNREKRQEAAVIAAQVRYIETAVDPDFQAEFVNALHIPHAVDTFPGLSDILPTQTSTRPRKSRRFQRTDSSQE